MKKILFLTLLSNSFFAQTINYSFSEEFETVKKYQDLGFYNISPNEYAEVYFRKGDDMVFQIFDDKFKSLKKQETIRLPEKLKSNWHLRFESLNKKEYWLSFDYKRIDKKIILSALPFDKISSNFKSQEILMLDVKDVDQSLYYLELGLFDYHYSIDRKKILIAYGRKLKNKNEEVNKYIIGFNLFDDDMKKIYSGEVPVPYSEDDLLLIKYMIDSKGDIYVFKSGTSNSNTKNELYIVDQKNNILIPVNNVLYNNFVNKVFLQEDLNHDNAFMGLYNDKKNGSLKNGAFILEFEKDINNTLKINQTKYFEYPVEILKAYETDKIVREQKMDKKDLRGANLQFSKSIYNPDGTIIIVAEENYINVKKMGEEISLLYYYYNDLIVLKVNKNGNIIWCNRIPKQQIGVNNANDLSYYYHQYKGEDYFLYLDNKKNMNLSLSETPYPCANEDVKYLTCVKIGVDGKMEKKSVFDIEGEAKYLYPTKFQSISENLIINYFKVDKNKSKIFKLEFE